MNSFCVINCEDSVKWEPVEFGNMFSDILSRPNERWVICNIAKNENLPENILSFKGVVISGSHYNCRDNLPWFEVLKKFILEAAKLGYPKIYGGCFGCQLIAHSLGGEVDYNPSGRFVLKAEILRPADSQILRSIFSKKIFEKLYSSNGLNLIVSHGDCVRKLPEGAVLLASSNTCTCEIYVSGSNHNIIGCQSHPEFDYKYAIEDRIWPAVVIQRKALNDDEITNSQTSFSEYNGEDAREFMTWIGEFLRS